MSMFKILEKQSSNIGILLSVSIILIEKDNIQNYITFLFGHNFIFEKMVAFQIIIMFSCIFSIKFMLRKWKEKNIKNK